jgi:S-adenosylhomocysteine hydrolase
MEYSYPLLQKVFEHFNKLPHEKVEDCYLVCCQHLLEPQLKMFQYLIRFGFNPEKIIVLGKVYSTNTGILKELDNLGIRTYQPEFLGTSFDKEHEKNCHVISNLIPKNNKIIILDDGGQLIISLSANKNVIFAVEQTSSGFRKLENKKINFPVINVARSNTKLVQESPFIARLCYERIKDYLLDKNIKNPSIIVIGLGR